MSEPYTAFEPLARLTLGDGFDGKAHERWVRPLAQLLEAASRGQGQLPLSRCTLDDNAPEAFFTVIDGMVLLPRNAAYLREIRERVELLYAQSTHPLPNERVRSALDAILPHRQELTESGEVLFDNREQRLAAAALIDARIGVLTGGPGTGKTTSAAALLAIRKRLDAQLSASDVLLCAPTGKAACRLAESMTSAANRLKIEPFERDFLCALEPLTLHRALEWSPLPPERGGPFRRNATRPLPQRLVLVDEASMVDLDLMTRLLRALSPQASLLLLGDSDQLESVETGGVLAELVARGTKSTLRVEQLHRYRDRMGPDAPTLASDASLTENGKNALPGLVVRLRHSYRAKGAPWILELAALARPGSRGTVAQFSSCCRHYEPHLRRHNLRRTLLTLCAEQWQRAQAKTDGFTMSAPPSDSVLGAHLRRFQLLCGSNAQVAQANRLGVRRLWDASVKHSNLGLPHGCPVLVTQNRATLGLSNGDVGIALGTEPGRAAQVVVFPGLHQPIPIAQLPEHQPAFALTIHKSQGSEWEKVAIDLPDESELLDRNLLYTAITRSSSTLDLYANDRALAAILEPVESM